MAKTKAQKTEIIAQLETAFKTAASAVFVSFTKVNASEENTLRKTLRESGVTYFVAKKTLIDRALKAAGHTEELPMAGEIAVAYNAAGEDASAPSRIVYKFVGELKDKLAIAGGIFEGTLRNAVAMTEIATIPSMDVLRGRFANVINSPRQRFAVVLSRVAETKQS